METVAREAVSLLEKTTKTYIHNQAIAGASYRTSTLPARLQCAPIGSCYSFLSRELEGPFQHTGRWCNEHEADARNRGLAVKKWLMRYTTCPKCAKKYGKNEVAIVSHAEQSFTSK
jgi:hypothetical protein